MTKETYLNKKADIMTQMKTAMKKLNKQFAYLNNHVMIGNIITDHYQSIKVESIVCTTGNTLPDCYYKGTVVNKNGSLNKRGTKSTVYQSNLKLIKKI